MNMIAFPTPKPKPVTREIEIYIGTDDGTWEIETVAVPVNTKKRDLLAVAVEVLELDNEYVFVGILNEFPNYEGNT